VVAVVGAELVVEEEAEEDSPMPSATTAAKSAISPVRVRTSVLKVLVHRVANAALTAEAFWLMLLATTAVELVILLATARMSVSRAQALPVGAAEAVVVVVEVVAPRWMTSPATNATKKVILRETAQRTRLITSSATIAAKWVTMPVNAQIKEMMIKHHLSHFYHLA